MHRARVYLWLSYRLMLSFSIGHFGAWNQRHAAFRTFSRVRLAYLWMHGAGPVSGLSSILLIFLRWFLFWWFAPWHTHGESRETPYMHIAFHAPHHLAARVHHDHHHEEHHHKHAAHVHHDLNTGQQAGSQQHKPPGHRHQPSRHPHPSPIPTPPTHHA